MKNKRREFLKNVCPTVALAFFGVTMLEACSSGGEDDIAGGGNNSGSENNGDSNSGYTVNGNTVTINLSHSTFSSLDSNGWMNFTAQNMLLLKIDSSTYRAFTNSCPHQGRRNNWSYNTSDDRFVCSEGQSGHGNNFPTDCQTKGSTGDVLKCYTTTYNNGVLTVVK